LSTAVINPSTCGTAAADTMAVTGSPSRRQ
jgi:hypothetical protein